MPKQLAQLGWLGKIAWVGGVAERPHQQQTLP
jgi:hypothetical protein